MEKETKHTPEALWEKMAREDWLAGEGFSGKFDGLSRVPHIFKPRIFEFAEFYSSSLQTELSEMKKEREELVEMLTDVFKTTSGGWVPEFSDKVESFLARIKK